MNPFESLPKKTSVNYANWNSLYLKAYDKEKTSPYTKTRIILMNGTEFEANMFLHQFSRHSLNNDLRRILALVRRQEQQQQKMINSLKPKNETILETTIAYEQLAVDLTAEMAKKEPNPFVKAQLDFALLEDFDHLYRYANLLDMEHGVHAERLVGGYTEITPGRPTVSEHRHPNDDIRYYINSWRDDLITRLHVGIITAAEQQTMNYYMNVGGFYTSDLGRKLYSEIAMIEEQHVTGYGSLLDPSCTWFESWVMHEYTECYLYYSCYLDETDEYIKKVWGDFFEMELTHLKFAVEALEKYEGRSVAQLFPVMEFPSTIKLKSNIEYIREVMKTVKNTALNENIIKLTSLPESAPFFKYQKTVNSSINAVPSHVVIEKRIEKCGQDYRAEKGVSVEKSLRDRKQDNTCVGRLPDC